MLQHGTCVARRRGPLPPAAGAARAPVGADGEACWDGVLLLGPPGRGKSDLALRLLMRPGAAWRLVADDVVVLTAVPGAADTAAALRASAPEALRGMLEARGVGLVEGLDALPGGARLALAVELVARRAEVPRLPAPRAWSALGASVPLVALCARDASAPERVSLALDAATGAARLRAGAFAP